jgi:hypothetical protein
MLNLFEYPIKRIVYHSSNLLFLNLMLNFNIQIFLVFECLPVYTFEEKTKLSQRSIDLLDRTYHIFQHSTTHL